MHEVPSVGVGATVFLQEMLKQPLSPKTVIHVD